MSLRNVRVRGVLDLAGTVVTFPLRFDGCDFDAAPLLDNAQLQTLVITDAGSPRLSRSA